MDDRNSRGAAQQPVGVPPPHLSVVLCTHNPRTVYLERTLASLQVQTLTAERWEFLLIDNASTAPLEAALAKLAHREGRVVPEDQIGLTAARLRGIAESTGEVLVFVDDDNVLAPDYLATVAQIATEFPWLGAWGGDISPEFEGTVGPAMQGLVDGLAIRSVVGKRWSNYGVECCPYGAGLCVRREVGEMYAVEVRQDPLRGALDRKGGALLGGGDLDLGMTSYRLGLGCGLFESLRLTHLIGSGRLAPAYLRRICIEGRASGMVVQILHGADPAKILPRVRSRPKRWLRWVWAYAMGTPHTREQFKIEEAAGQLARSMLARRVAPSHP